PEGDPLAAAVVESVAALDVVEEVDRRPSAQEARAQVEDGAAGVAVLVPQDLGEALTAGRGATVEAVLGDDSGLEGDVVVAVVNGVLDRLTSGVVAGTAGSIVGLPPEALADLGRRAAAEGPAVALTEGTAPTEQLSA